MTLEVDPVELVLKSSAYSSPASIGRSRSEAAPTLWRTRRRSWSLRADSAP